MSRCPPGSLSLAVNLQNTHRRPQTQIDKPLLCISGSCNSEYLLEAFDFFAKKDHPHPLLELRLISVQMRTKLRVANSTIIYLFIYFTE